MGIMWNTTDIVKIIAAEFIDFFELYWKHIILLLYLVVKYGWWKTVTFVIDYSGRNLILMKLG